MYFGWHDVEDRRWVSSMEEKREPACRWGKGYTGGWGQKPWGGDKWEWSLAHACRGHEETYYFVCWPKQLKNYGLYSFYISYNLIKVVYAREVVRNCYLTLKIIMYEGISPVLYMQGMQHKLWPSSHKN